MKTCSKCELSKPLTDFYRNGKGRICKKCEYDQQKEYAAANPERIARTRRNYVRNSTEIRAVKRREYRRKNLEQIILTVAKNRAKRRGIVFDLELCDIVIPEFCPVLGLKLDLDGGQRQRDSSPSLDRIVPTLGYIKGNIAVISNRANLIKNCGTAEEHLKIADYMRSAIACKA